MEGQDVSTTVCIYQRLAILLTVMMGTEQLPGTLWLNAALTLLVGRYHYSEQSGGYIH
jgi:hypothetical protein